MKLRSLLPLAFAAALFTVVGCSKSEVAPAKTTTAVPAAAGELLAAKTAATPEWLAKEIAAYPMQTCAVSTDKLGGSMGPTQDYVWRVAGQPDRLVRFCCNDCLDDFKKTPAKFLAIIDEAKAKK
jgi:hypothetical protein